MAILSKYHLPMKWVHEAGKGQWEANLLSKAATRDRMHCIYKIRLEGDKKQAGVYVKGWLTTSSADNDVVELNIAGHRLFLDKDSHDITFESGIGKYSHLIHDNNFREVVMLTCAHFGYIKAAGGVYKAGTPVVRELEISAEVAETIDSFGVF